MTQLQLTLDRPSLPRHGRATRHLIARITPPTREQDHPQPPLDLAVVIDASGSMAGAPLAAAKQAVCRLARELPAQTRLTVVSFANDVIVHTDGCPLDGHGRATVEQLVAELHTRGCTNLHSGWRTACTLLLEERTPGRRRHAVVLSDGLANRGVRDPAALAAESRRLLDLGVSTSCIGIGDRYSPLQLAAIADNGGGACHDAIDANEIVAILAGEVLGLADVVANAAVLTVRGPSGVRLRELSGLPSRSTGDGLEIAVGALRAGVERRVVVRAHIPAQLDAPLDRDVVHFTAHLDWRDADWNANAGTDNAAVHAHRTDAAIDLPALDDARTVLVAWQAGIVQRVTDLNRRRDHCGLARLWDEEYAAFVDYASLHPETHTMAETMQRLRRRASQPMPERRRKQAFDIARKMGRQEEATSASGAAAWTPSSHHSIRQRQSEPWSTSPC